MLAFLLQSWKSRFQLAVSASAEATLSALLMPLPARPPAVPPAAATGTPAAAAARWAASSSAVPVALLLTSAIARRVLKGATSTIGVTATVHATPHHHHHHRCLLLARCCVVCVRGGALPRVPLSSPPPPPPPAPPSLFLSFSRLSSLSLSRFQVPTMAQTVKAVILIGGPSRGTRFRPLSFKVPKPLFPVAGEPVIEHHIEACAKVSASGDDERGKTLEKATGMEPWSVDSARRGEAFGEGHARAADAGVDVRALEAALRTREWTSGVPRLRARRSPRGGPSTTPAQPAAVSAQCPNAPMPPGSL